MLVCQFPPWSSLSMGFSRIILADKILTIYAAYRTKSSILMGSITSRGYVREIWSTQERLPVGHWDQKDKQNFSRKRGWESVARREESIRYQSRQAWNVFKELNLTYGKSRKERAAHFTYHRPKSYQICKTPSLTDPTNINWEFTLSKTLTTWAFWTPKVSIPFDSQHLFPPAHTALNHVLSLQFQKYSWIAYYMPSSKNFPGRGNAVLHFPCSSVLLKGSGLNSLSNLWTPFGQNCH